GPDAQIRADAITSGDGGKVIVWADDATRAYGTISARGGAQSGNGGFVEVSGKNWLDFSAIVDTSSIRGAYGTLLLDPANVNITTTSDSLSGSFSGGRYDGGSGPSTITWATIDSQLASNNVVITTSGSAAGNLGDINVANASPALNRANSLWLVANNDITVNGSITNTGGGGV